MNTSQNTHASRKNIILAGDKREFKGRSAATLREKPNTFSWLTDTALTTQALQPFGPAKPGSYNTPKRHPTP